MKTITQVAQELGVCRSSVWHHVRSLGLGKMTGSIMLLDASDVQEIKDRTLSIQKRQGMVTVSQLMKELGLSRTAIVNRINKLRIPTEERQRIFLTEEQADLIRGIVDEIS